jgi:hypothetical protein
LTSDEVSGRAVEGATQRLGELLNSSEVRRAERPTNRPARILITGFARDRLDVAHGHPP